jgi:hypothetical protein
MLGTCRLLKMAPQAITKVEHSLWKARLDVTLAPSESGR